MLEYDEYVRMGEPDFLGNRHLLCRFESRLCGLMNNSGKLSIP
jgi:hypothetical protein